MQETPPGTPPIDLSEKPELLEAEETARKAAFLDAIAKRQADIEEQQTLVKDALKETMLTARSLSEILTPEVVGSQDVEELRARFKTLNTLVEHFNTLHNRKVSHNPEDSDTLESYRNTEAGKLAIAATIKEINTCIYDLDPNKFAPLFRNALNSCVHGTTGYLDVIQQETLEKLKEIGENQELHHNFANTILFAFPAIQFMAAIVENLD